MAQHVTVVVQRVTVTVRHCLKCLLTETSLNSPVETLNKAKLGESNLHTIERLILAENPGFIPFLFCIVWGAQLPQANSHAEHCITQTRSG